MAILRLSENATNKLRTISAEAKPLAEKLENLKPMTEAREDQPYLRLVKGRVNIRKSFVDALRLAESEVWVIAANKSAFAPDPETQRILTTLASKHLKMRAIITVDESSIHNAKQLASVIEIRHRPRLGVNLYGIDNRLVAIGLVSPDQRNPEDRIKFVVNYPTTWRR